MHADIFLPQMNTDHLHREGAGLLLAQHAAFAACRP
jgi:hypothetical protein